MSHTTRIERSGHMKSLMRHAVVAIAALGIAGAGLGLASPAAANGTLVPLPESGNGSESWAVTTSGGCANDKATHYIIRMSGGGLSAPVNLSGVQPLSSIPALPAGTTAMTIQVPTNLEDALPRGLALPAVFDVAVICREALKSAALVTFTGKITVFETASGITFKGGAQPIAVTNTVKPRITGQAKVGSTLTAVPGTWTPTTATFAIAWKVDGKQVGTGTTYRVKASDRGKAVVAEVTATADGLKPGTASATVRIAR